MKLEEENSPCAVLVPVPWPSALQFSSALAFHRVQSLELKSHIFPALSLSENERQFKYRLELIKSRNEPLPCGGFSQLGLIHTGSNTDARRKETGPVPFVRVTLRRTLLGVQCVQDCCYNRICASRVASLPV